MNVHSVWGSFESSVKRGAVLAFSFARRHHSR
jgi:hypothetical protein